ncbi:MAG: galactose-1-phosphate uridylyltransferase [candidate division WOR-3 bacterium]
MSEFRWDRMRELCSILAEKRGERPLDFAGAEGLCPFCHGNEAMTPPEITKVEDPWRVRVFPNKYPATDCHEVIVDSPIHGVSLADLPDQDLAATIAVWRERVENAYSIEEIRYVSLFHNHGMTAGASRKHIHTQLIGLPFVPPTIEREISFYRKGICPIEEIARSSHRFHEEGGLVAFCPEVSRFPYEVWIIPIDHQGNLPEETICLASVLKKVLAGIRVILSDPDYNLIIKTMPGNWHWRAEIIPRTGFMAGFELDTGCHILSVAPESAAEELGRALAELSG